MKMFSVPKRVIIVVVLLGNVLFRLSAQTVEERIDTLLNRMTLDEKFNQLHQEGFFNTPNNPRLGIPGFVMADGPHGVRDGLATSFPVGIGMASTWDVDLAYRIGVAMGKEFRGKGKHQALGPCLDIDRDPRNGRSPETGGEDPYLCARITTEVVKGIQSTPCIATIKHYNANHRENGRTTNNIIADRRVLNESAGLAFRTAVQEGGAMCVMNAYNLINGQYCAESPTLLTSILRTQWGFPFYVVSDWGSIVHSDLAITAGCDICMGSNKYANDLPGLVSSGVVPDSVINNAVRRVLRTKFFSGMLDYQPPGDPNDVNSTAHQQLCLEAGRKSLVLLKNLDQILPINKSIGTIAVVGPNAAVAQTDGRGSSFVTPFYSVSPKQGIENAIGTAKVLFAKGCDINSTDTTGFSAAVQCAQGADVVLFCGGLDPSQEGEGADRTGGATDLPRKQQDLINALAAANPHLIVVIYSGGVCSLDRCFGSIKGLLYAFYPGQEGGNALAEVVFGDYNPGGKMPGTMPLYDSQLPVWNDDLNDDYGCGYRWYDRMQLESLDKIGYVPQFAFGYGLSYTTFSYNNLRIFPASVAPGEPVMVQVDVSNTGTRTGDEVIQIYLSKPESAVQNPLKELKGFKRMTLDAGQTLTAEFSLTADELYSYNEASDTYEVETGQYTVRVGGSSDNLPLVDHFEIRDDTRRPDLRIVTLKVIPPYPLPGQKVIVCATVKNQGSAPIPAGRAFIVSFSVNGQLVSWSDECASPLPAGGMTLIYGDYGPNGISTWTAAAAGTYEVEATLDPDNAVNECVETNNTFATQITVYPQPPQNLAYHKPVIVSSFRRTGFEGENAVDGNMSTQWSSPYSDPQFIIVDLGVKQFISTVELHWGTYAKEYYIQISDDMVVWTDEIHVTDGDGGTDVISVGTEAQYVRMLGIQRGSVWGYSLFEIEIYGTTSGEIHTTEQPRNFFLFNNYPNPFNPSTTLEFTVAERGPGTLQIYNILGQKIALLFDQVAEVGIKYQASFLAAGLPSGVYVAVLESGKHRSSIPMMLIK